MKKFFAIALAVILLLSVVACSKDNETEGESEATTVVQDAVYTDASGADAFTYVVNEDGSYDIKGFTSTNIAPHKVEIPSSINNIEVTGIAADAFKACNQISEIVIPESITSIGDCAFARADYLTKVTMSNSVKTLGSAVFDGCKVLADVTLSGGLETLSDYTFRNCIALESITLPASIKEIGDGAFFGCIALKNVTLNDGLKTIGDGAFYGDTALEKIAIPASVENFGAHVFKACNENFTIVAAAGSAAAAHAESNEYKFEDPAATPAE